MALPHVPHTPVAPTPDEASGLAELQNALSAAGDVRARITLSSAPPEYAELPASTVEVLRRAVAAMSRGNAVTLYPVSMDLTTQQATDLLNIPRQYLNRLLEAGELPFDWRNNHRRLRFADVMAYRNRRAQERHASYRNLLAIESELSGQEGDA